MTPDPVTPIGRVSASKWKGAGDVVARVAEPIASLIDRAVKTNLSNCAGCKKRREALNKLLPFDGK